MPTVQWGMSTDSQTDHLTEIAELLAAALTRLQARKSSRKSAQLGESSLHFTPDQSGDAPPCSAEVFP
jgi:GAF domain-containing protein